MDLDEALFFFQSKSINKVIVMKYHSKYSEILNSLFQTSLT